MTQARLLGGRYQVGELLGYGGMAEVHRGRDLRLGRDVAIKMLRPDLARDNTFQMRFRREAQNAAALNHPAIVAVYDTGEERAPTGETLPYIVMEFVSGRTLKEVLTAEGRLMPRRALEISADVCAALEFSHRHGIIHRDIKPGNVMLTQNGQVKVMDFGIARALASGATTMTQTSAVIGTAQYLSPEQARGEAVDARSDVYAAGCVLFELLCGHPPFVGDSPVAVAYQHVREEPKAPSESNRDVSPDLDAIVLKALSKNPINRYQSAGEMRADLLRAAAGRPVLATPVLREDETLAMPTGNRSGGNRNVARVGDARRRRTSGWLLAALSALGVLAVVALTAGLILANQPKKVDVPSVVGLTQAKATEAIVGRELKVAVGEPILNGQCTKGQVTQQDPAGGKLEIGDAVTIRICDGAVQKKVPGVLGLPRAAIDTTMKNAGFTAVFVEEDSDKPKDTGLSSTPAEGTNADEGSVITVKISKGNMGDLPSVVGKSEEEARTLLQAAGFNNIKTTKGEATDTPGTVLSQSPNGNQKRKFTETITLVLSQPQVTPSESPSPSP
ncbi:serine/threonine-protein kinase [Allocatelliglobosispora scoriae]|uniref:non-specific serine/threonine protein kinase n=1 Tax=Allocatelliglobosispora scoriae TaxID=643052 RepID=A0A841BV79_9ACTN|nr:Stk1 family PASTA domain-containing Ser/Thr kinase [Allocatelliglobosispora scoriae]MBB5871069.1 serine/threonine-protein kinase [Allocatelliglobosispora scoriae]